MFFNSIKEKNMLRKEINRLFSKGMSNIYLKVLLRKSGVLKLSFYKLKHFVSRSVFAGAPTHADMIKFSNFFLQLINQRSGSKIVCVFSIIFNFEKNYDV